MEVRYIDKLPDPKEKQQFWNLCSRNPEHLLTLQPDRRSIEAAKRARVVGPGSRRRRLSGVGPLCRRRKDFGGRRGDSWNNTSRRRPHRVDVLRAEQEIAVEIAGVPFFGIVDLTEQVSDGIRVVDYKTGKAPSSRFVEDKLSQVWLYAAR